MKESVGYMLVILFEIKKSKISVTLCDALAGLSASVYESMPDKSWPLIPLRNLAPRFSYWLKAYC